MSHPQIDSFNVNPSKHKTVKRIIISIGYANKIKYFKDYMLYKAKIGKPILDIRNIDMQDYIWMQTKQWEMKRIIEESNAISNNITNTSNPSPISTCMRTNSTNKTLKQEFIKTIKRDMNLFPKLDNEKYWDSWNRTLRSIARVQDVADVLDPNYIPIGLEEIEVFAIKQQYMYTVFEMTLKTSQ